MMITFTGSQVRSILKVLFSNILLFSSLGLIIHSKDLHNWAYFFGHWLMWGIVSGIIMAGLAYLLQFTVNKKRKHWMTSEFSLAVHRTFKSELSDFFHIGHSKGIVWTFGWHILPAPRIPRKGFLFNVVFSPQRSDILYDVKKELSMYPILHSDTFYISFFFQSSANFSSIKNAIDFIVETLQKSNFSPGPNQCLNCRSTDEKTEVVLIDYLPVPLCPSCRQKTSKKRYF